MTFSYANPTSGPSAGGIGWFNFGNLVLKPGDSYTGLTGTLNDGSTVTFDLSSPAASYVQFDAVPVNSNFGITQYSGILGNVILYSPIRSAYPAASIIIINNIVVKDNLGNPISNYTAVVADGESTNSFPQYTESWTWTTTGGNWKLFDTIGGNAPLLAGVGTPTAVITGVNQSAAASYVLTSQSPTSLTLSTIGHEGVAIGFAVTKVTVQKQVGQRINASDQFVLNIGGTPNSQVTTTGSADGIQSETAFVDAFAGNVYTINEAMAPGSGSTLSQYTVVTSALNATLAGTIPPTGSLPINFTPALGDNVTYTILNAAPETFLKTVDKVNADIGDVLTYTVTVNNPNSFTINNVLVTDSTPVGTTYVGNLAVSAPFTGTAPATGLTITSIGPDDSVTISWQVKVNTIPPVPTPITNLANVAVPGGTSGSTNVVQTNVNHAFVSTQKSVDLTNASPGDVLTYTLSLTNFGNVAANQVVVTDPIPAGTTYVTGSVSSSVGFSGTPATSMSLTAPLPAGGSAIITYKVLVGSTIPANNPILNTAKVAYAYTVDPAVPNGIKVASSSNQVTTQISKASLKTVKSSDKTIAYLGDIITYQVSLTNAGNVPASNVVLTDPIPNGTIYVPNSLSANVPFTGSPMTTIHLTNFIAPGATVSLSYQVQVTAMPNPNPIANTMSAAFTYTVNPLDPNGEQGSSSSNTVNTLVFKNNYSQEISDLIHSIALEEAAIGNLANAEGAKIQRILALSDVSANELLCVNKSVTDMLEALGTLESILKQKLSAVDCQINPSCM